MTKDKTATRRSFLRGGALIAAPVAAAAVPAVVFADGGLKARVERLESEAAIRDLHQSWLRRINAGAREELLDPAIRRITQDHAGTSDKIEIAADGRSAVGHFACTVESEVALAQECTLAQMALAQGNGTVRQSEPRMLRVGYAKANGAWKIGSVTLTRL